MIDTPDETSNNTHSTIPNIPKGTATKDEYNAVGILEDSISFLLAEVDKAKCCAKQKPGLTEQNPLESGVTEQNPLDSGCVLIPIV
mmetsp:Transcript_40686/g.60305  ORF Transcript_40686/g.60305 Transcript_40686/m.60305 type:complete len:86 (-) Transcript_40686:463-720(-)|eukprot:CAMPEP_0194067958 /NCGR_PEP_ID=MMETSP0009_2-20130614/86831_1 /TAXON_ID=210454 /ORGANISM="Grammatophora oceanica, Strain CCMP 410" /LENGTH=85 /DNA_ID=CAMNT_0038721013 /DNA_START=1372 /DNA_END=1629 /DNA_ORIENTATION=+